MNDKDKAILKEADDNLKIAMELDRENRAAALADLEFIAVPGKQWPDDIKSQRLADGRPCLEINKMPAFVDQVVGDQRMNRPSIKVLPVDDVSDPAMAKILGGWIKHVFNISQADVAIDHAFEHAVSCGYGAMRVVTKYVSDESFDQEAYIQKIENALAVYWGPHEEYDCSDAPYCFIISDMPKDAYKATYKKDGTGFVGGDSQFLASWSTKDTVRVAEYFKKEPTEFTLYMLEDGRTEKVLDEQDKALVKNTRKVTGYKIVWYLLSGDGVLEKRNWVGKKYIPVIPVWGKETNVGGKRYIRGLVRNAKDSQRMYNYWQALSLDTLIPTPDGWLTMADIRVGQEVFDEEGNICSVTNVSPTYYGRPCYEVLFDDGTVIVADENHLWEVEERGKRTSRSYSWTKKVIVTKELDTNKHFIYVNKELKTQEKHFTIPPYVLGVWLGDGTSNEPNITQSAEDAPLLFEHLKRFGCSVGEAIKERNGSERRTLLGLRHEFVKLNLLGNKHIPYDYTRGSIQQRLELLQGLMDTDGSVNSANGSCDFTTTSEVIAKGFLELTRSLGIKAKYVVRDRGYKQVNGRMCDTKRVYQFYFTTRLAVFRLARKLNQLGLVKEQERRSKRYSIVSVTPITSVPVRCITVNSQSSLYLAGSGMIPTHNSIDTEVVALQPRVPYLLTPKQVSGHESMWKNANKMNYSYLLVNSDKDAPDWPHRESPPQASSAMVQKIAQTDQEMRDTIGLQKASLGMQSNERSGAAIRERKKEGDVGTFAFMDNLARSTAYLGRVLLDVAPGILDTQRVIRLGLDDETFDFATINEKKADGNIFKDVSIGHYDVRVSVGPSFTTQRTEARESMQAFIQYYPQASPLIGDLYAKANDWPGADEVAKRLEHLLPPEIRIKNEMKQAKLEGREPELPAPPPPDPNIQLKTQEMQFRLEEQKVRLAQEEVRLKVIELKSLLELQGSQDNIKAMVENILKTRESAASPAGGNGKDFTAEVAAIEESDNV